MRQIQLFIIGLIVIIVGFLFCARTCNHSATSVAYAQNMPISNSEYAAIQMLNNGLRDLSSKTQISRAEALIACALLELSKKPNSIPTAWKSLTVHLENKSLADIDTQLDLITDFQNAVLEALLSSKSQEVFDSVWNTNQNIIKYRDNIIITKLGTIVTELQKNSSKFISFNSPYIGSVSTDFSQKLDELDLLLTIASDINDKSISLIDKIKESQTECTKIADKLYEILKRHYDLLVNRLNDEQAKEKSETGNGNYEPIYNKQTDKWKDGGYYLLSKDIQNLQRTIQNSVIENLLSLLYSSENNDQLKMNNTMISKKNYINFAVELQNMQGKIVELIQIRYNIYANSLIHSYRNSNDNKYRIQLLVSKLTLLDSGLLYPIVNNQLNYIIDENVKPEPDKNSELRDTITNNFLVGKKIPLEAF